MRTTSPFSECRSRSSLSLSFDVLPLRLAYGTMIKACFWAALPIRSAFSTVSACVSGVTAMNLF